jgi:hypothetical protein
MTNIQRFCELIGYTEIGNYGSWLQMIVEEVSNGSEFVSSGNYETDLLTIFGKRGPLPIINENVWQTICNKYSINEINNTGSWLAELILYLEQEADTLPSER